MTRTKKLEVRCYGELVGYLAETPDHVIAFQYADSWIRNGFSISPLSLPLGRGVFVPPEKCRERFSGLFGVCGIVQGLLRKLLGRDKRKDGYPGIIPSSEKSPESWQNTASRQDYEDQQTKLIQTFNRKNP